MLVSAVSFLITRKGKIYRVSFSSRTENGWRVDVMELTGGVEYSWFGHRTQTPTQTTAKWYVRQYLAKVAAVTA